MKKSSTKERILSVALVQYNEQGVERVTIRSIAKELGMSPGNLTYHFKNTDYIIYQLYLELVDAIDQTIFELQNNTLDLQLLYDLLLINQKKMFRYRFILLEFATIARRVEAVGQHYRNLIRSRQEQFQLLLGQLIAEGYLEEWIDEEVQLSMIYHSFIFSNSWIPDAFIHFEKANESVIPFYARLQMSTMLPFLTEKGRQQYDQLMALHYKDKFTGYPS